MDLVTSTVFYPGVPAGDGYPEQVLVEKVLGLVAVSEARGGGEAGRAGVRIALETVRTHMNRHRDLLERFGRTPGAALRERVLDTLRDAISRAATEVFAFARRHPGLQATLDVLVLTPAEAFVAHVGDGRIYLVRNGLVHQLTVDHLQQTGGRVLAGERRVTRALGQLPNVEVESMCMEVVAGDRFVVAGASVHHAADAARIRTALTRSRLPSLGAALRAAVDVASPVVAGAIQIGASAPAFTDAEARRLERLAPMDLFEHCTRAELRAVAQAARPRRLRAGTVVFEQGDVGKELFLLIEGAVDILRDGRHLAHLETGTTFGEMAMLDEPQRSATVVVSDDCELLVIPRDAFFALLRNSAPLAVKILWNLNLRLSRNLRHTSARLAELERRFRET